MFSRHSYYSMFLASLLLALGLTPVSGPRPWPGAPVAFARERAPVPGAQESYRRGVALQRERRTLEAIAAYEEALKLDPFHARAHWEIGWSYWVLAKWAEVVRHWEIAAELNLDEPELEEYLGRARDQLEGKAEPLVRAPIGTQAAWRPATPARDAAGADGTRPIRLELVARFQHYDPSPENPADRFDRYVFSPKAVHFVAGKAYVNALEGFATLVFDPATLRRRKVISHVFDAGDGALFAGAEAARFFAMAL